jgi:hypothetical protein
MTKFSRLSRFGMTFKPLTESRGEDLLMWYREAFLAKTYPVQEEAQELTESDPGCGAKWHELSAKYDLGLCSWRTHQCLWDEELHWSSVTLPRWGMTVSGVLFQHPTAERPISETGSGYWLTPTTMNIAPTESRREKRTEYKASVGRKDSPGSLAEQVMTPKFWPTPRSCSAMAATITPENSWDQDRFPNLETIVGRRTWPTPQARDWKGSSGRSIKGLECDLPTAVKWPTPTAHNAKETNAPSEANRNEPTLASRVGGHLNPMWVEWLMGWPLGWTDLKPLAMDKFLVWQQQHSEY